MLTLKGAPTLHPPCEVGLCDYETKNKVKFNLKLSYLVFTLFSRFISCGQMLLAYLKSYFEPRF